MLGREGAESIDEVFEAADEAAWELFAAASAGDAAVAGVGTKPRLGGYVEHDITESSSGREPGLEEAGCSLKGW